MKKHLTPAILFLTLLLIISIGSSVSLGSKPSSLIVQVLGQNQLTAGSQASFRIITYFGALDQPAKNVQVKISLTHKKAAIEETLFTGVTDTNGTLDAKFKIPNRFNGEALLKIVATSNGITKDVTATVNINRVFKVLLTTDKPLYQPSQTINIRALALQQPSLVPVASGEVTFEVMDGKGNKVFKQKVKTSKFGIAACKFVLANEVNMGNYNIQATLNNVTAEKTVSVKKYVLPKFKNTIQVNKQYFRPAEKVTGTINSAYFFGKPVANADVVIKASTFDVSFKQFAEIKGKTDDKGFWKFELQLPDYFTGQPLEKGESFFKLEIEVTDTAKHTEKLVKTYPVVKGPIKIEVFPESTYLIPNLPNNMYVLTTYPDGTPAPCTVTAKLTSREVYSYYRYRRPPVTNPKAKEEIIQITIKTDSSGFGKFIYKPALYKNISVQLEAKDTQGNKAETTASFYSTNLEQNIIIRPNKAIYKVGDTLKLNFFATKEKGTAYIDFIRDGQTILTKTVDIHNRKGLLEMDLSPDHYGSLVIHAYSFLPDGNAMRDTKRIYVQPANNLAIDIKLDKNVYLPAEKARLTFSVRNKQGMPVAAALGVDIVDESLFALVENKPGLELVYFLLEKELMEPKYEIHGLKFSNLLTDTDIKPHKQQTMSQIILTKVPVKDYYTLNINSETAKIQETAKKLEKIKEACIKYHQKFNKSPRNITELIISGLLERDNAYDAWGRKMVVQIESNNNLLIMSLGSDGKVTTEDDLKIRGYWCSSCKTYHMSSYTGARRYNKRETSFDGAIPPPAPGVPSMSPIARFSSKSKIVGEALPKDRDAEKPDQPKGGIDQPQIKVREYFPETLYTNPQVITDNNGNATLEIPMADSITTWRMMAFANSLKGEMGNKTEGIRVFQDFFIDLDLPVALTQNDEIAIPVAVYNYLQQAQTVNLTIEEGSWFNLLDTKEKTLTLSPNEVNVVYYRIKVKELGNQQLTVFAKGTKMSDAIRRVIEILPDGKEFIRTKSDKLEKDIVKVVNIPQKAIDNASNILVTIYPGIFSQVVEGLDSIFQMPSGCFEQTSSTTYPNVLVLDYLKKVNKITPEIQMKAEGYINTGYQRLVSYEVPGGGFSWFGTAPANKVLTAYGVMEFFDMSRVYSVDANLITRTQQWLISQQEKDGSWKPDQSYLHADAWKNIQNGNLVVTAYITWALLESKYKTAEVENAVEYIKKHYKEVKDPYSLALCANALVAYNPKDPVTLEILETLDKEKITEGDINYWKTSLSTTTHSEGLSATIETTALAAYAFLKSDQYQTVTNRAIAYLIKNKDNRGTWHSTQATVLTMKTLIVSILKASEKVDATVDVFINGTKGGSFKITSEDFDVFRQVDLKKFVAKGKNTVEIKFNGQGNCFYKVVSRYYMPWKQIKKVPVKVLDIDVSYDRTQLAVNDTVTCKVKVANLTHATANMVIVDVGVPPGFSVDTSDLDKMVGKQIQKFSLTGRQIIIYLEKINPKETIELTYGLRAKYPIRAKTPKSSVYKYYNPEEKTNTEPVTLEVK